GHCLVYSLICFVVQILFHNLTVTFDIISFLPSNINTALSTFSTHVVHGGNLLGAMKRLMASNADFKFSYTKDPNFGPYLESVNGVAGNDADHTYWELLVQTPGGKTIRPDVGIGCYIPSAREQIILRFIKW
uniref:DUF4430 domain-containing protein n=1 Tax=Cyclopterus lumpus TaxID=8103 RepID=A0A8C3A1X3_CYCLU